MDNILGLWHSYFALTRLELTRNGNSQVESIFSQKVFKNNVSMSLSVPVMDSENWSVSRFKCRFSLKPVSLWGRRLPALVQSAGSTAPSCSASPVVLSLRRTLPLCLCRLSGCSHWPRSVKSALWCGNDDNTRTRTRTHAHTQTHTHTHTQSPPALPSPSCVQTL